MNGIPREKDFWAKLEYNKEGNVTRWHPLLAHSADVAAMTEALLQKTILRDRLAKAIGWDSLSETHISRISALAAIHDAGKANHGFQNRAFQGKRPQSGHVSPLIEVLETEAKYQKQILIPLGIGQMQNWFSTPKGFVHFLLATWGHHGRPVTAQHNFRASLWEPDDTRDPLHELNRLGDSIKSWFPSAFEQEVEKFPENPLLQHAFNGLLTLADWLGSDQRFFPFAEPEIQYIDQARSNAANAVTSLVLDPKPARRQLGDTPIEFKKISKWDPFDIQKKCMELPIFENGSLTVLESDTGSGKTEAALARFVRLYQAGLVDGMYFAVPTRSAATQLYDRVQKATKKAFPDEINRPPVVQAVSGYIKVDAAEGKPLPNFNVLWPEDRKDLLRERGWAGEHPKRYLAGAIVVGTIDQVFLSTLQVNHAHMRAAALLRHFLVVDEVHASDAYMTKLLDRVLDLHLAAGGHALLMSATLGTSSRFHLTRKNNYELPEPEQAREIPYPLLTHVDASRYDPETYHGSSSGQQKTVKPELQDIAGNYQEIARLAVEKAKAGARVLIIRNLIKDCIKTQQALEEVAGEQSDYLFGINAIPAPHHSRFAPEDRRRLDHEIENYFGKDTNQGPAVAVATQTVEQSLDIDADLLITDLCPMDVLLQRIGRLHRHKRTRPEGFDTARCIVLTPQVRDLGKAIDSNGKGSQGDHGLGTVYQDLRVLEATWRVLKDDEYEYWHIPKHNRELVELATHPHVLRGITKELGESWDQHQQHIAGQEMADRQLPGLVGIDFSKPFGENGFAEDLKKVKTRLGRDDYQVFLPEPQEGPFGEAVEEMTITEWQVEGNPEDSENKATNVKAFDGGFTFKFCGEPFRYDRFGLTPNSD